MNKLYDRHVSVNNYWRESFQYTIINDLIFNQETDFLLDEGLRYTQIIGLIWKFWDAYMLAVECALFFSVMLLFQVTLMLLVLFLYIKVGEEVYKEIMTELASHILMNNVKYSDIKLFSFSKDSESTATTRTKSARFKKQYNSSYLETNC